MSVSPRKRVELLAKGNRKVPLWFFWLSRTPPRRSDGCSLDPLGNGYGFDRPRSRAIRPFEAEGITLLLPSGEDYAVYARVVLTDAFRPLRPDQIGR